MNGISQPKAKVSHLSMEQVMRQMHKVLADNNFSSLEEANEFLNDNFCGKKLDEFALPPATPAEEAMDLVYKAEEADDPNQAVELAREALRIDPNCADAYLQIAYRTAETTEEALDLYKLAILAAERTLGEDFLKNEEHVGHYWGILETRPYMRAREALASSLWDLGKRPEAIRHYKEMLRLCPNDNMGLRYSLVCWLIAERRYSEAKAFIHENRNDPTSIFIYMRALLAYKKGGPSREARALLNKAFRANPYYLAIAMSGKIPDEPDHYGYGDESEAVTMLYWSACVWESHQPILFWMADEFRKLYR